jgi:5-methyltetrahydrofolate--homocysteine methyltransferase
MVDLSSLREAILDGDAPAAAEQTREALKAGTQPVEIIGNAIGPAMAETGKRFEEGEFFIPELLMAARATKEIFEILRPMLAETGARAAGTVVLGTVRGDQHDIGKNLVGAMLEGAGFEIMDLGVDVPPEKFIAAVQESRARFLGLSALLTTTLPAMKKVVEASREAGIRDRVKIVVGGAPVTPEYAEAIGADGYAENASAAVEVVRRLLSQTE